MCIDQGKKMSVSNNFIELILKECISKVHNDPTNSDSSYQKDIEMLRTAIIAEFDAINLYDQMAVQAESEAVRALLLDIAREEKVHVGELEALLEELDTDFKEAEEEGEEEIEEIF